VSLHLLVVDLCGGFNVCGVRLLRCVVCGAGRREGVPDLVMRVSRLSLGGGVGEGEGGGTAA
jgi:hypothetical protein